MTKNIAFLLTLVFSGGCGLNVFGPIDSPTSDPQLQSAARACLDQGDATCALGYYSKMTSNTNDVKQAEGAYAALYQQGATFGAFLTSVGSSANMGAIGRMANQLVSGAGATKRKAIYNAYKRADTISDTTLKNFVKFVTSFALTAEILAETAGSDGRVTSGDLVSNSSCYSLSSGCNAGNMGTTYAACAAGSSALTDTPTTAIDLDSTDETTVGANLSLALINTVVSKMSSALSGLGSSGSFGSFSSNSSGLAAIAIAVTPNCFRYELLRLQAVPQ